MKFTKDDVKLIEKLIKIKNAGYYASGNEVTDVYNRVLEKRVASTGCGQCIRQRITELENALNAFKRNGQLSGFTDVYEYIDEIEAIKSEISSPVEAFDSVSSDEPTTMKVEEENKPVIKKAGRPKKK